MPYIQNGVEVFTEEELGGVGDWLKKAGGWLKEGAKAELIGAPGAPAPAYMPPPEPTFMQKFGPLLLLGGAGLVLFMVLRGRKKD